MPAVPQVLVDLLNKTDATERVIAFMMPLRVIRIVSLDRGFSRFRVEQLIMTSRNRTDPRGTWAPLSLHTGQVPGEAYGPACKAAVAAQNTLHAELQKRMAAQPKVIRP